MKSADPAEIPPTIYVVDDDASVRKALARLFTAAGYLVESFASARGFLDRARQSQGVNCVVLDVCMPDVSGLDLQRELKALAAPFSIIFLTGHADIPMSVRAMKEGAVDFLSKPIEDHELLMAVQSALARSREDRLRYSKLRELQLRMSSLTPRELEVMSLVVRGRLNKQVAKELGTVEKTIKVHRARVMEKMKAASLADLVVVAEKLGFVAGHSSAPVLPPLSR